MAQAVLLSTFHIRLLLLFMSIGWDCVSEEQPPTDLLFITQITYEYGEPRWNDTDRRKPKSRTETCPNVTLSTTNPTWTDWPGPRRWEAGDYPLRSGTAFILGYFSSTILQSSTCIYIWVLTNCRLWITEDLKLCIRTRFYWKVWQSRIQKLR
jgi:hypothetical protein